MVLERLNIEDFQQIKDLMREYKLSINEVELDKIQYENLLKAIENDEIEFYVVKENGKLIAMCSICITFSTFKCQYSGVFEDFYIAPQYRKRGIARKLTQFVFKQCKERKIGSLWVGCADIDLSMYKELGFEISLGNLLTWCNDLAC